MPLKHYVLLRHPLNFYHYDSTIFRYRPVVEGSFPLIALLQYFEPLMIINQYFISIKSDNSDMQLRNFTLYNLTNQKQKNQNEIESTVNSSTH